MPEHQNRKIYSLRHWLFYAGVIFVLGTSIGAARSIFDWSDGLTFAVGIVAGMIACTMALREDLFEPAPPPYERRGRRA
jgi:uncharacterized membrane protein